MGNREADKQRIINFYREDSIRLHLGYSNPGDDEWGLCKRMNLFLGTLIILKTFRPKNRLKCDF